jgi:hypothetical protein
LTQEPLAPWLQFEIGRRLNKNRLETGLLEKRFVGQLAISQRTRQPLPMLDVETKALAFPKDPMTNKHHAQFGRASLWHTMSMIGYSTIKTLTMVIRPRGRLPNSGSAHIFMHANRNYRMGLFMRNRGQDMYELGFNDGFSPSPTFIPVQLHKWYHVVIQYLGNPGTLSGYSIHVVELARLNDIRNRQPLLNDMIRFQNASVQPRLNQSDAGHLILGAADTRSYRFFEGYPNLFVASSFEGDVQYIRGYRQYINTDEHLVKEMKGDFASDWPQGPRL